MSGVTPDWQAVFAATRHENVDALIALEEPVLGVHANTIAELAGKDRLPTLFPPSRAAAGALLSYGTSQVEAIRRMAALTARVLKGAQPGELPLETVQRYELVVNLRTAREIGIAFPAEVLQRADRVIQ